MPPQKGGRSDQGSRGYHRWNLRFKRLSDPRAAQGPANTALTPGLSILAPRRCTSWQRSMTQTWGSPLLIGGGRVRGCRWIRARRTFQRGSRPRPRRVSSPPMLLQWPKAPFAAIDAHLASRRVLERECRACASTGAAASAACLGRNRPSDRIGDQEVRKEGCVPAPSVRRHHDES